MQIISCCYWKLLGGHKIGIPSTKSQPREGCFKVRIAKSLRPCLIFPSQIKLSDSGPILLF